MTAQEREQLELARTLAGWELAEYRHGGEVVGFGILRGTEFHCHLFQGAGISRKGMRQFLRPLFERHGFLTTRVQHSDLANQKFNRLFGFKKTWSDSQYHYFLMAELPFAKKEKSCQ